MNGVDRYDDAVWDRFFDFVSQPVETMTREEVQSELSRRGIDVTKATSRVHRAVEAARARSRLQIAKAERPAAIKRVLRVVAPDVSGLRIHLRRLIESRLQGTAQAAYFRKLEAAANDEDLRALLDDIERLNALSEENHASEDGSE